MFELCIINRVLCMKNIITYTVLNADIPVVYMGVSIRIHVKCKIRHSVKRALWKHINAYIMVSALIVVKYVIKRSVQRAI